MSSAKQYNLPPYKNIPTQSVSSGTVTSSVTDIYLKDNILLQFIWTDTLAGTFDIQVSTNYDKNSPSSAAWDSLPLSSVPTASGSASNWSVNITELAAKAIRVVFTWSGGSGNLTSWISAKAV